MKPETFDALVIGAGQGGVPLARDLAAAGRRTALIESDQVGGTCVNCGCTPTKTMVASARVAHLVRRAADYGVRVTAAEVDLRYVRRRKREIVASFREGSEKRLAETKGLELIRGRARFVGPKTIDVGGSENTSGAVLRRLTAELVILDVGGRPVLPEIPGLADAGPRDSTSIMELAQLPDHLIVLGGGYIGLEFGQMFRRFGCRVTIIHRRSHLLPREDVDVSTEIARILEEDGIELQLEAQTRRVTRAGDRIALTIATPSGERTITGRELLVAAGRRSNADTLDLAASGLATDARGFIPVDEKLETAVPGIYALGDVKGGPAFTHISYDDYRILRANLLENRAATTSDRFVPYVAFLDPELGRIGLTEQQARASGAEVRVAKMPMSHVARALETDETRGFMKVVVDAASEQILGAAILGVAGGEIMSIMQIAMQARLPFPALRDATFAHPTFAEALNNLFHSWVEE